MTLVFNPKGIIGYTDIQVVYNPASWHQGKIEMFSTSNKRETRDVLSSIKMVFTENEEYRNQME